MANQIRALDFDRTFVRTMKLLSASYGDFVAHNCECASRDEAVEFLQGLSFISGKGATENLQMKADAIFSLIPSGDRTHVILGGRFTDAQDTEIRERAKQHGIKTESSHVTKKAPGAEDDLPGVTDVPRVKEVGVAEPEKIVADESQSGIADDLPGATDAPKVQVGDVFKPAKKWWQFWR